MRASATKPIAPGTAGMTDHMDVQQGANLSLELAAQKIIRAWN
jgi:hypothetical protein